MTGSISLIEQIEQLRARLARLEAENAELRVSYQMAPVGLCVLSPDLRYLHVNEALAVFNGASVEAHLGRTLGELIPDLEPAARAIVEHMQATRSTVVREIRGRTAGTGGQDRIWIANWSPVFAPDGALAAIHVAVQDVTERKRAEEALRESERQLQAASDRLAFHLENTPLAVIEFCPDFRIKSWGRRAEEMFGWTAAEVVGKSYREMRWLYEEDAPLVEPLIRAIVGGSEYRNVIRNRNYRKDGSVIYCEWYNSVRRKPDGSLDSLLSLVLDVTGLSTLESRISGLTATLQSRAELFERLLDANPGGIAYSEDASCRNIQVNRALAAMLGIEPGTNASMTGPDASRLPFRVFREGKEVPVCDLPFETVCRKAEPLKDLDLELRFPGGHSLRLLCYAAPLLDPQGKVRGCVGAFIDVTDLRSTKERLELAQETGQIGVYDWNASTRRAVWTPQLERMFGFAPGTYDGTDEMFARRLHPEDLSKLRETVANAYRNRSPGYDFEFRVILPSGETRWQSGRAAIFYGEDGSPQRILGVNVDITERRRVEEELRRSNTDLTQFAYAVSHDLKQPLRMISVFSQLLEKKYGAALDSRAREMVEIIAGAADRMDMLLKGLLEFSRLDSPHDRPDLVDCNDVVRAVLANLAAVVQETGAAVTVETLPRVYAHRVHLIQLFQNLLSNALKYRRPDVRCEIELRVQRTGSVWLFELEDNGLGIEPDQADYIFGIFKRLHGEAYEGTGIGLALCRRIVESYGGRIWVQSEPGNGSVFRFTIPVTESA